MKQFANLSIYYQPQYCYINDIVVLSGSEALLRCNNGLKPDEYIEKLPNASAVKKFGLWMFEKVCQQYENWIKSNIINSSFSLSININNNQFSDKKFVDDVFSIINNYHVEPSSIILEITESFLINDYNVSKIFHLSEKGIKISIDDFGTGYSSLYRLKSLPIDEIKIDKIFIDNIYRTPQDHALVTAMYELTNALDKHTIVEGVENTSQLDILRDIGFSCFQGYLFSTAKSPEEVVKLLS